MRSRHASRYTGIAASVFVHAGALAWIVGRAVPATSRAMPALAALQPPPVAPPSIAPPLQPVMLVELIELESTPPIATGSQAAPTAGRARPAVEADRPAVVTGAHLPAREASAPPSGIRGPSALMTMRPPRITAGLSAKFQDDLLAHQRPLPPPPPPPNTAAHAGDDQIAALEARLSDRGYRAIASADEIANRELDLESLARDRHDLTLKPVGRGRFHNHEESFDVDIAPDGSVAIHDAPLIKFEGLMIRFDVTDMIMRARGEDPYARAKLHFLDRTRDERAELGRRNRAELLSRSLVQVRAQIDRLWAVTPDPAGRREGLFELWDDCAEVGDAELVAGAVAARRFVIGVIRGRLRGTDAYTDDELARLNARRRSTGRFAPYDEAPAD